jgi:hypothetical protein
MNRMESAVDLDEVGTLKEDRTRDYAGLVYEALGVDLES